MEPLQSMDLSEFVAEEKVPAGSSIDLIFLRFYELYEDFKNDIKLL